MGKPERIAPDGAATPSGGGQICIHKTPDFPSTDGGSARALVSRDLFDWQREREQAAIPAIRKLMREHRISASHAALVVQLSGLGGCNHGR